ncbi:hypothetical protein QAD02_016683 [Eretmocerus hayati]|uniref:Uncharacterized protein n=2 Tax=Eretmocerus hayati TaxID=131215 RepID=A0ACC2PGK4_9HYME|nr:hypothetical protein QAD02_016682 [Eretmocerus hayati]KAJ8680896.1 hypothetical protein QAD02_016683 [Eretmocerus hayati]
MMAHTLSRDLSNGDWTIAIQTTTNNSWIANSGQKDEFPQTSSGKFTGVKGLPFPDVFEYRKFQDSMAMQSQYTSLMEDAIARIGKTGLLLQEAINAHSHARRASLKDVTQTSLEHTRNLLEEVRNISADFSRTTTSVHLTPINPGPSGKQTRPIQQLLPQSVTTPPLPAPNARPAAIPRAPIVVPFTATAFPVVKKKKL